MDPTSSDADTVPRTALRTAVGRLRACVRGPRFDPAVHLGVLGGWYVGFEIRTDDLPDLDAGTRTAVVAGMLGRHRAETEADTPAAVWLTRPGEPAVQDVDLAWLSAAHQAFAEGGEQLLGFWVVTRSGWIDPRSGERRTWARLRLRDAG